MKKMIRIAATAAVISSLIACGDDRVTPETEQPTPTKSEVEGNTPQPEPALEPEPEPALEPEPEPEPEPNPVDPCAALDATLIAGANPCDAAQWIWDGTACVYKGGMCECVGTDCAKLQIFDTEEDCSVAFQKCIAPPASSCDPMDAEGYNEDPNNPCDAFIGYKWNGSDCEYIGGFCECRGADCDKLYQDEQVCIAAHAGC